MDEYERPQEDQEEAEDQYQADQAADSEGEAAENDDEYEERGECIIC